MRFSTKTALFYDFNTSNLFDARQQSKLLVYIQQNTCQKIKPSIAIISLEHAVDKQIILRYNENGDIFYSFVR